MIGTSHLQTLLTSRPIVLWVEDRLTREYLSRIWQPEDQLFNILIGARNETVRGIVRDLRVDGAGHVFGLIDRDFNKSNYSNWFNAASKIDVYTLTRIEIENYLLDWPALANCRENQSRMKRSESEISSRAKEISSGMIWWMSCRSVLSRFRDLLIGDFPSHPTIEAVKSQADAEKWIVESAWYRNIPANAEVVIDPATLEAELQGAFQCHQDQLADDSWMHHFSGKEIFQCLRGYLFNANYASTEEMNVDLAKSIADWQVGNQAVPRELNELKEALKRRVGI